jgi:hypothetical protein
MNIMTKTPNVAFVALVMAMNTLVLGEEHISRSFTVLNRGSDQADDRVISRAFTVRTVALDQVFEEAISRAFSVLTVIADCNDNGLPDPDEIAANPSLDCDGNGVLDECEDDCDGDGTIDACDDDIDDDGVSNEEDVCDCTPQGSFVEADGRRRGDYDADCDVDLSDFARFQMEFDGPGG